MVEDSTELQEVLPSGDAEAIWSAVEAWMMDEGYPTSDIVTLEDILKLERVLGGEPTGHVAFKLSQELDKLSKNEDEDLLVGAF